MAVEVEVRLPELADSMASATLTAPAHGGKSFGIFERQGQCYGISLTKATVTPTMPAAMTHRWR